MKIYLAGPMTGYPNQNYPAFDNAKRRLQAKGHLIVSPADISRVNGFDGSFEPTNEELRKLIAINIEELSKCEAIALLPGWIHSIGARIEFRLAQYFQMLVFRFDEDCLIRWWKAELPGRKNFKLAA